MKVIIAGAGIAGLSLALSLHQAGIETLVFEAVSRLDQKGVGINLQPTAVRELTELGLGDALAQAGNEITTLAFFNKHGQQIWTEPRGLAAGFRWPQYGIHRGRLQDVLLTATTARLGPERIRLSHRLTGFSQDASFVTARFTTPSGLHEERGDVLVGADGIHSALRRALHPNEGAPRFAQQVMWRAVANAAPYFDGHTMIIAGHYHQRVVSYPLGPAPGGLMRVNWLVQRRVAETDDLREDWNRAVPPEKFQNCVQDWRFPWLDVPSLITRSPEILEYPLLDRDPVDRWSFGRVTLIGDAAHPMHPVGSQAGSQAVVDARLLTAALQHHRDPPEALAAYDQLRRPQMNEITLRNRAFGPEAAMQLAEDRAPNGFTRIEDVISRAEMEEISQGFQRAAGLDVASVNNRPSFLGAPIPAS